jgi:hypothetical protein
MKTISIAIAASLGLALARAVLAADPATTTDQERERVRAQVHHQITTQGGVSEREANDLDAEVSASAAHAGYGPAIKSLVQTDLEKGCKGTCLAADIHAMNGAVAKGVSPDEAVKATTGRAGHGGGAPSDPQARSEDHRQDPMHDAADRAHDRTMDHGGGQTGMHGMSGGHH